MKKYIFKRIITSLFTLLAILLILFILMQLMPGSPFNDEKLNNDQRAALFAKYGLDQPVVIQFFKYVLNMIRQKAMEWSGLKEHHTKSIEHSG